MRGSAGGIGDSRSEQPEVSLGSLVVDGYCRASDIASEYVVRSACRIYALLFCYHLRSAYVMFIEHICHDASVCSNGARPQLSSAGQSPAVEVAGAPSVDAAFSSFGPITTATSSVATPMPT